MKRKNTTRANSIESLWGMFVAQKGDLRPSSLIKYKFVGDRFCTFIGRADIDPIKLNEYVQMRRVTGAAGNNWINVEIRMLKAFLKFLKRMRLSEEDFSDSLTSLPPDAVRPTATFTEEEFHAVRDWAEGREWAQPFRWLFTVGYRTGMSLVDACHLRWSDVTINTNGQSVISKLRQKTIRRGETSAFTVPVIPGTEFHDELLERYSNRHLNYKRADGINDYVHEDCPGLYEWKTPGIHQRMNRMLRGAGIHDRRTFRHLRTTFVSNLVNSGVVPPLICKMTGHSNMAMLMKYLRADVGSMADGLLKSYEFANQRNQTEQNAETVNQPG